MSRIAVCRSRTILAVLLVAQALVVLFWSARAGAAEPVYGGLGALGGALKVGSGESPSHGQVNSLSHHSFITDAGGDFYVADEDVVAGKRAGRVQEFGPKGEFKAENQVALAAESKAGGQQFVNGLALDSSSHRVYLLVVQERQGENEAVAEKREKKEIALEKKEEQLVKAEKEGKTEEAAKLRKEAEELKAEIKKLEEEEPVFDEFADAAAVVWSFSSEVKNEELAEQKRLVKTEALQPLSEEGKVPLLHPGGIAVNPVTHDLVIVGQQDESTHKGSGEESLRAAVQLIHENGTLGPRYLDAGNCLDEGTPTAAEPACGTKEGAEEFPRSPVVTSSGRVLVELAGAAAEIWEVPTPEPGGAGEKPVQPHRAFTLDDEKNLLQTLLTSAGEAETANTMAFASTGAGTGRIYTAVNLERKTTGVLVLEYSEHEGHAEISEVGWTAGLSRAAGQEKCFIPVSATPFLVAPGPGEAGPGQNALVFDTGPKFGEVPGFATVLRFGAAAGSEACGKPSLKTPTVAYKEAENAVSVPVGAATRISSKLEGANAKKTRWVLEYTTSKGEKGKEEVETGYQYGEPELPHAFAHIGEYTIHETVETDDLGSVTATAESTKALTVTPAEPTVTFAKLAPFSAGETETVEASIADPNEAKASLKLTWKVNDESPPVEETIAGAESPVKAKLVHKFGTCHPCTVTLSVVDGLGAKGSKKLEVEEKEPEAPPPPPHEESKAPPPAPGERHETLPSKETHDPKATIAGASTLTVAKNGSFTLKVTCPAGQSICTGTVTLKTLGAVSAKKSKKAILTLASGSFSLAGGKLQSVTLHLSGKAKSLLARVHTLKALATLSSHDSTTTLTTKQVITLRAAKKR
jgi:hypothetical protein